MAEPLPDKKKSHRHQLDRIALVIAFLTLIASLMMIWVQLTTANQQIGVQNQQLTQQGKVDSAKFALDLDSELNSSQYTAIMTAIENHPHTYSPLAAGFRDNQLEEYMGEFDTIGNLYRDGIIAPQMAYDEFSYDAEKTYCNVDVRNDITRDRQESKLATGTDAFWSGFQSMAVIFLNQDGYTCTSTILDNQ
jgi:hypothetical protein